MFACSAVAAVCDRRSALIERRYKFCGPAGWRRLLSIGVCDVRKVQLQLARIASLRDVADTQPQVSAAAALERGGSRTAPTTECLNLLGYQIEMGRWEQLQQFRLIIFSAMESRDWRQEELSQCERTASLCSILTHTCENLHILANAAGARLL